MFLWHWFWYCFVDECPVITNLSKIPDWKCEMSRALKKAVEAAKHRKDGGEVNVPDEGIANPEDVPELCE